MRGGHLRAGLRGAALGHCPVYALIHDRGRDKDHYWLATEPILDPDYIQRCIVQFWRPDLALYAITELWIYSYPETWFFRIFC